MRGNKARFALETAYRKGYRVTEDGRLLGLKGQEIALKLRSKQFYPAISISIGNGKGAVVPVHRLAAYCFYGDNLFTPGIEVRHLNANVFDVSKENICLGTSSENHHDKPKAVRIRSAYMAGKATVGIPAPNRKLSSTQVREIRNLLAQGITGVDIAKQFGVSDEVIYRIKHGRVYRDVK